MNPVEVSKIHGKITCFRHQKHLVFDVRLSDVPHPGALRVDAGGNCFFEKGPKKRDMISGVYSWGMCEFY